MTFALPQTATEPSCKRCEASSPEQEKIITRFFCYPSSRNRCPEDRSSCHQRHPSSRSRDNLRDTSAEHYRNRAYHIQNNSLCNPVWNANRKQSSGTTPDSGSPPNRRGDSPGLSSETTFERTIILRINDLSHSIAGYSEKSATAVIPTRTTADDFISPCSAGRETGLLATRIVPLPYQSDPFPHLDSTSTTTLPRRT